MPTSSSELICKSYEQDSSIDAAFCKNCGHSELSHVNQDPFTSETNLRYPYMGYEFPRSSASSSWVGFDLDGTLAKHTEWTGPADIGEPIGIMIAKLLSHIAAGDCCRIFTARCYPLMYVPASYSPSWLPKSYEETIAKQAVEAIRSWLIKHIGFPLEITCVKDYHMKLCYDDRCQQVQTNTGLILEEDLRRSYNANEILNLELKGWREKALNFVLSEETSNASPT